MLFSKKENMVVTESYDDIIYDFNNTMLESTEEFCTLQKDLFTTDIMLECMQLDGSLTDDIVTEESVSWIEKMKTTIKKFFDFIIEHLKKIGNFFKGLIFNNKNFIIKNGKRIKENMSEMKTLKYKGFAYDIFLYKYIIEDNTPMFDFKKLMGIIDKEINENLTPEEISKISNDTIMSFRKTMSESLLRTCGDSDPTGIPKGVYMQQFKDINFVNKVIECRFKQVNMSVNHIDNAGDKVEKNQMVVVSDKKVLEDDIELRYKIKNISKVQSERVEVILIDDMMNQLKHIDDVSSRIVKVNNMIQMAYKITIAKLEIASKQAKNGINAARITSIIAKQWANDAVSITNKVVSIYKNCSNEYRAVCETILNKKESMVDTNYDEDEKEYKNSIYNDKKSKKDNKVYDYGDVEDANFKEA